MEMREFLDRIADSHGMYIRKERNGDYYLIDTMTDGMVMHGTLEDVDQWLQEVEVQE